MLPYQWYACGLKLEMRVSTFLHFFPAWIYISFSCLYSLFVIGLSHFGPGLPQILVRFSTVCVRSSILWIWNVLLQLYCICWPPCVGSWLVFSPLDNLSCGDVLLLWTFWTLWWLKRCGHQGYLWMKTCRRLLPLHLGTYIRHLYGIFHCCMCWGNTTPSLVGEFFQPCSSQKVDVMHSNHHPFRFSLWYSTWLFSN